MNLGSLQQLVLLVLTVAAFGMQVYALVDAVRTRKEAFDLAGKLTKQKWVAILGVAAALGFVSLGGGLGFLAIIAVVAAGVYLADVRPAVRQIGGGHSGERSGPYGPW